ncbi:MAG: MlaE family lipid ABC transporter permease subunit [Desulfobacterales bacterium]|nr:MlaE family lipid ABC transporter permease subunit [Desulfobacterales bacterium]
MEISIHQKPEQENTWVLTGDFTFKTVALVFKTLQKQINALTGGMFQLDLSGVTSIDTAGVASLIEIARQANHRKIVFQVIGIHDALKKTFSMLPWKEIPKESLRDSGNFFSRIGEASYAAFGFLLHVAILVSDIFYWSVIGPLKKKAPKWQSILEQANYIGAEAVGIVGLTSFLVGMTLALLSSYQLRQFGADIFVANLIGVAMAREMGPLIAAIIVAGRSGAAIAAEIATMMVTEEIDALKTMGINPTRFIITPKLYAITFTQPLLTVISDLLGIFGGFVVGVVVLQLSPVAFINQLLKTLFIRDIITGLIKSVAFAWIIAIVGTYKGFQVQGGAKGVGLVTTSSVVICLFLIIMADAVFSILFMYID